MKPLRTLSKAEFDRLSHPEKLEYLTALLEALQASPHSGVEDLGAPDGSEPLLEQSGRTP